MKKSIVMMMVAAGFLTAGVAMADNAMSIGVVNYMQVFQQVPQGKATLEQMKAQVKPQIAQLKAEQTKIEQEVATLNRNAPTMTADARNQQAQQLAQQQSSFQQQVQALQQQEAKKEQVAADAFNRALNNAINQVATQKHLSLVLNSQAAPYYAPSYDITSQVVTMMQNQK